MFPSGALELASSKKRRALLALAFALAVAITAAAPPTLAQATPQAAPTSPPAIAVDSFSYDVGDTLHLSGQNLEPNATYSVTLTPPEASQEEPRSLEVSTDEAGDLRVDALLRSAGAYSVALSGPRIDARLTVQVAGTQPVPEGQAAPEDAPGVSPGAESVPDQPELDEPGRDQSDDEPALDQPGAGPLPDQPAARPDVADPDLPDISVTDAGLVAMVAGAEAWSLSFGPNSGGTAGLLVQDGVVLVGHGNHLLQVDPTDGTVGQRERLPARIENLTAAADGSLVVTVRYASGATQDVPWPPADDAVMAFDPDPALYGWLEAEADVADPVAQLERDPTNPWLYLAAAEEQPARLAALRRSALSRAQTFYEYGRLAHDFLEEPARDLELAAQAVDAALADFAARGYRAELLFDESAAEAYGFPTAGLRQALAGDDSEAADFWAPWAYRLAGADATAGGLLADYADELRASGRSEEASSWAERSTSGRRFEVRSTVERAARALGSTGWYGVIALLAAIVALHLTLAAKYWRAQSENLALRAQAGRSDGRSARLFTLRYATITEKIVLILLFAAVLALAALTGWVERSGELPAGLGSGSLATPPSRALLEESLPEGAERSFALGYAAQTAGDEQRATAHYRDLSSDADAMNNLGVIRNDDQLYRLALELDPGHPEASFNLGLEVNPSPLLATYRPDEPLLAAPDRTTLTRAAGGDHLAALGAAFTNPWAALTGLRAFGPYWLWVGVVVLFLAWIAWTVITLLIPRPASARTAPRTFLYHLLALLLPGSGLADELWGVVLLLPWAIFGIDTLLHFFAFPARPTYPLTTDLVVLAVIYLINTVAFIVEYGSYRRRMRELRATTAYPEYGLSDRGA